MCWTLQNSQMFCELHKGIIYVLVSHVQSLLTKTVAVESKFVLGQIGFKKLFRISKKGHNHEQITIKSFILDHIRFISYVHETWL